MFYSHQLLARKAPLGQIWMAATMHAKINRRKLSKLNIIKICEEILNPSVPMALRLSGILMGGVVIVYERKVKLLYEDVTRLLVEINEAWKIKPMGADPSLLPKSKNKARYETVTLADKGDMMNMEMLHCSNTTATLPSQYQQNSFFDMRLDHVEEHFIHIENGGEELPENHHQADAANITIFDPFDSHQADTSMYNRFERFDIQDYDDGLMNTTFPENIQIPSSPPQEKSQSLRIPSPPDPQVENQQADEIPDLHPEPQNQQSDERRDEAPQVNQDEQRPRRTAPRNHHIVMDYEQNIISGPVYQSWLKDNFDILSRGARKNKRINAMSTIKRAHLEKIHCPAPLLELRQKRTKFRPSHDSPSGRVSPPQPPAPSSSAHLYNQDPLEFPLGDFQSGVDSQTKQPSLEKQRHNPDNVDFPVDEVNLMFTPGNSAENERSVPSSASGNEILSFEPEVPLASARLNTKRPYSSSRHSGSDLPLVSEDNPLHFDEPTTKLRKLSPNVASYDQEMLIETGPTQTQHPLCDKPIDKITDSIRRHLKTHFDTPGAPQIESLDQLTLGMNKKKAAQLFYQTCVLATHDLLRVKQTVAYADILISKGSKM